LLPSSLADESDGRYPSQELLDSLIPAEFVNIRASTIKGESGVQGTSRWHKNGQSPVSPDSNDDTFGPNPVFEAEIDVSSYPEGTTLAIFARAKVDKAWLTPASNVAPDLLGPVSHIVNARRNPSYYATNAGKVIQGQKDDWWYSHPITIIVGSNDDEAYKRETSITSNAPASLDDNKHIKAVQLNARMSAMKGMDTKHDETPIDSSLPWILGAMAFVLVIGLALVIRRRRKYYQRRMIAQLAEEEDGFSISSYRDDSGKVPVV